METFVFVVAGAIVLAGALGVVLSRNPVHAALSLVASLFGIAVLFVAQDAHLLAAVQVIVYTGAIVVLILFVLMLLGVDEAEDTHTEPITGQRPLAVLMGALLLAGLAAVLLLPIVTADPQTTVDASGQPVEVDPTFENVTLTGQRQSTAPISEIDATTGQIATAAARSAVPSDNVRQLGRVLFTTYVFPFEVTALLLTIAVVGAVVLAKRVRDGEALPAEGASS